LGNEPTPLAIGKEAERNSRNLELLGINFIFVKNKVSSAIRRYFTKIARTEVCQRFWVER